MSLFRRLSICVLLGIYGLFSLSLGITLAHEGEGYDIVIASSFSDRCNWNIQCEKQENDTYTCDSTGEAYALPGGTIQYLPVGKFSATTEAFCGSIPREIVTYLSEKPILYEEPDTFIYPFVRIIKIQV